MTLALMCLVSQGLVFIGCSANDDNPAEQGTDVTKNISGLEKFKTKIDYSNKDNWLSLPGEITKPVDVFYLYPTVTGSSVPEEVSDIDEPEMRAAAEGTLMGQASAFAESCNIFAPFYRQISLPETTEGYQEIIDYIAQYDACDAIDYYFTHLNQGRPFILVGHSQGSATTIALFKLYLLKHPELLERMVTAYIIGFSVTKSWLQETGLKFAEGANDTGVIISWNTEGSGNKDAKNLVVLPGAVSINPINWKRDDTYAPASDNLGSLDMFTGEITVPGIADAQVDTERGVVVVTTEAAKPFAVSGDKTKLFGPESYHTSDYGFFYNNIKQNVSDRVAAYLNNTQTRRLSYKSGNTNGVSAVKDVADPN